MENEKYQLKINNESGRIDKVLAVAYPSFTRSQIQSWLKSGHIQVNGKNSKANYKVLPGDIITLIEPDEETIEIQAENIPLMVVYEDEALAVINKPAGMVVHPSKVQSTGTLVNGLLFHMNQLSEGSDPTRPGIVHRIDKDTSGLLVIAKTNDVHEDLAKQFLNHTTKRTYVALVHGEVEHEEGTIDVPIDRMPNNRIKRVVDREGKPAVTHFTRLEQYNGYTLLQLELETGRTHQIRVHMDYIHHPVVGDPMYGTRNDHSKYGQYLHAQTLGFVHPITKEELTFQAPLPNYFETKLEELRQFD